jgi:hypothetical protein
MKNPVGKISLIIFLLCVVVYSANFRVVGGGDCWAPRYIPVSLLREGNLDLNEFEGLNFQVIETEPRGKIYRVFAGPVLSGIFATPVYGAAWLLGLPITRYSIAYLGKLAATIYSALSVVFIFLLLKELLPRKAAVAFSLIYAFGTCTWVVSSQSLWRHGLSQCLLAVSLYCLFKASARPAYAGFAGFFLSLATVNRYPDGVIALIMFIYVLHRHRSQVIKFLAFSLPALLFFLIYNWFYFATPFRFGTCGYFLKFNSALLPGLAGILFSPNRGLFVFSPFFLFSVVGAVIVWKKGGPDKILYRYLTGAIGLFIILVSKWQMWWGGHSYGYRLLVDLTPLLMVLSVPAYRRLKTRRWARVLFILTAAVSCLIQLLGALYYEDYWNSKARIDRYPERVWRVKNGQFHWMIRRAARRGWKVNRTVFLPRRHRHPKRYL